MAKSNAYGGITPAIWSCIKTTSAQEHGTQYVPADGDEGTATTSTPVGDVVLGFSYDPSKDTLNYTILKKPFIVGDSQIWNGIQETIDHCKGQ